MIFPFYGGRHCLPWDSSPISFLQRVRAISTPYKKKNLCFTYGLYRSKSNIISSFRYCCYWLSAKAGALSLPSSSRYAYSRILASFIPTALDKYYLPHLRACEMLIGSLTAVWMQYRQQQGLDTGKPYAATGALLSVCVLFACLFAYTEKTAYFPGPAAIIPCLAAAAFIYFNQFEHRLKQFSNGRLPSA